MTVSCLSGGKRTLGGWLVWRAVKEAETEKTRLVVGEGGGGL